MTRSWRAPWSRLLRSVSTGASLILLGVTWLVARAPKPPDDLFMSTAVFAPLVVLALAALFTVRGYQVENDELRILRLVWTTRIQLDGLRSAEARPDAMSRSIRLFGNGGLFSFTGLYRNRQLGNFRAWVTDPRRAVILRWDFRTVVVSPEDPVDFAETMQQRIRSRR